MAESGMTAFETGTVESCRSLGRDAADLFRPASLVETQPKCATSGPQFSVSRLRIASHSAGGLTLKFFFSASARAVSG